MPDIWLPDYTRVDLGWSGGTYDEMTRPKLCWHTTEGASLAGAERAFRAYPPHLGVDPRTRERHQYVPLNRHAYALAGAEADDEYVVQVEVVGYAAETHTWPDEWLRWLGEEVVRPIRDAVGVPNIVIPAGFRKANEGVVLASPKSPIRLTLPQLRAFSGHLAHQHMPPPDAHWDAGGLPIDDILRYSEEDTMQVTDLVQFRPVVGGAPRNLWDAQSQVLHVLGIMQAKIDAGFGALQDDEAKVVEAVRGIVAADQDAELTITDEQVRQLVTMLAAALPAAVTVDQMQAAVRAVFADAGQPD